MEYKVKNKLQIISLSIIIAGFFAQIACVFYFWDFPRFSDFKLHQELAYECYSNGVWYPSAEQVNGNFVVAIGFINWLVVQLKVLGNLEFNALFNVLMNVAICAEIFYLGLKLFNKRVAYLSAAIYSIIISNIFSPHLLGTEIPYLFLGLSAITLIIVEKWWCYPLAGFLFFSSNTIRPSSILFILFAIFWMLITRRRWWKYIVLIVPILCFNYALGSYNEVRTGLFLNKSTTGGYNLIQVANDESNGGYMSTADIPAAAGIVNTDLDCIEKDQLLKNASIKWILDNPFKYIKQRFKSIVLLYRSDAWSVVQDFYPKTIPNYIVLISNIPYYLLMILFCYSIFVNKKEILTKKGVVLLYILLSTGAICLFPVYSRYHHAILFAFTLWASFGLDKFLINHLRSYETI